MPGHERLRGHTGGNLLLSMMEQYSGDFLAAVDGLRVPARLRRTCVAGEHRAGQHLCAEYGDGTSTRARWKSTRGRAAATRSRGCGSSRRPRSTRQPPQPSAASTRVVIGPGSFYTSLMPIFLVRGAPEAIRPVHGPVVLVTNLLTEGRGMWEFTAGDAVRLLSETIGRQIDVALINTAQAVAEVLERYRAEHKAPLEIGQFRTTARW